MPVISITSATPSAITFTWTLAAQGVTPTGFMLYYTSDGGPTMSDMIASTERLYTLSDLQPGSAISISLVALSNHLPSAVAEFRCKSVHHYSVCNLTV